ncbi:MAG: hypothetical protein EXR79_15125, partial [Myxococcales bacterium]|nr:hypothetical protein [Myxococcales bacterium]
YKDLVGQPPQADLSAYAKKDAFHSVAFSGNYSELKGGPDLKPYVLKTDLAPVAQTGAYKDLTAIPPAAVLGKVCGTGLVIKGFKGDGSYECVPNMDPNDLPPDGIDEISNKLIFNQFVDSVAGKPNIPILDNNPGGSTDTIEFPDIGIAQKLTIVVDIANSNVAKLAVYIEDPNKQSYTLYAGASAGGTLVTSYPDPTKPVSGDLLSWLGKNPKGKWTLKVVDSDFLNNAADGAINKWSLNLQTLSNKKIQVKGDLIVDGNILAASNLKLTGSLESSNASVQKFNRKYTVLMSVRKTTLCPSGWNMETSEDLRGPNNYVYANITERGLYLGAMNGLNYGNEHLYMGYNYTNGIQAVCWKEYDAPSGNAHTHIIAPHNQDAKVCPKGYLWMNHADLAGNNNHVYLMSNNNGLYLGYVDTWAFGAQPSNEDGGWHQRTINSGATGYCMRTYGVSDDPETANGVFPVVLGMKDPAECPAGWEVRPTSQIDGSNDWIYNTITDNVTVFGAQNGWDYGGDNYMQFHWANSHVNYMCWKMFAKLGRPGVQIRTLNNTNTCPSGFTAFSANNLKGWNDNGYLQETGSGLYIGGLYDWARIDYSQGWIAHNFTSHVNAKVCLKMSNVKM